MDYSCLFGEWTPISTLHKGDVVKVMEPFVDSTKGLRIYLDLGTLGTVVTVDEDGDAEINFHELVALTPAERNRWILLSSFRNKRKLTPSVAQIDIHPTAVEQVRECEEAANYSNDENRQEIERMLRAMTKDMKELHDEMKSFRGDVAIVLQSNTVVRAALGGTYAVA